MTDTTVKTAMHHDRNGKVIKVGDRVRRLDISREPGEIVITNVVDLRPKSIVGLAMRRGVLLERSEDVMVITEDPKAFSEPGLCSGSRDYSKEVSQSPTKLLGATIDGPQPHDPGPKPLLKLSDRHHTCMVVFESGVAVRGSLTCQITIDLSRPETVEPFGAVRLQNPMSDVAGAVKAVCGDPETYWRMPLKEVQAAFAQLEWSGSKIEHLMRVPCCPQCDSPMTRGHEPGCLLRAYLTVLGIP